MKMIVLFFINKPVHSCIRAILWVKELCVRGVPGHGNHVFGCSFGILQVEFGELPQDPRVSRLGLLSQQPGLQVFVVVELKSKE